MKWLISGVAKMVYILACARSPSRKLSQWQRQWINFLITGHQQYLGLAPQIILVWYHTNPLD
jgi:hypothetical protein